jgi:hypothetical protein
VNPGVVLNLLIAVFIVLLAFAGRRRLGVQLASVIVSSVSIALYFGSADTQGPLREMALGACAGSVMVFFLSYGSSSVRIARFEMIALLTAILGIGASLAISEQSWVAQGLIRAVVGTAVVAFIGRTAFSVWSVWRGERNRHRV